MNDESIKSHNQDNLLATVLSVQGRTDKNSSLGNWKGVEQLFLNSQIIEEKILFSMITKGFWVINIEHSPNAFQPFKKGKKRESV